jgi:hypothetical protein
MGDDGVGLMSAMKKQAAFPDKTVAFRVSGANAKRLDKLAEHNAHGSPGYWIRLWPPSRSRCTSKTIRPSDDLSISTLPPYPYSQGVRHRELEDRLRLCLIVPGDARLCRR